MRNKGDHQRQSSVDASGMVELAADGVQDQMRVSHCAQSAQASLQSSNGRLDTLTHDLNGR